MNFNERCPDCDSRYCGVICYADSPAHVYVVGRGYVTHAEAKQIEADWDARGLDHGLDHGTRRVEWDRVPAIEETA